MKIIKANLTHCHIIQTLAQKIWPIAFQNILNPDQINYMLEMMYSLKALNFQMSEKQHQFLLLEENENYFGFAAFETNYDNKSETKIHKLYVLPNFHGKGLGKKLMTEIERIASENKNEALILNVNRFNKAIQFYEAIGFSIIKEENIDIGNNYWMEDFVMRKEL